jgi:HEAT repeat protein
LEKVVYFECRVDQLATDLAGGQAQIGRLKDDLARAAERELRLKHELASLESKLAQSQRERDEARTQLGASRAERERFLEKLLDAEHIRQAGRDSDEADLASFIAELRSEVIGLRPGNAPQAEAVPAKLESAQEAAAAFAAQGRIGVGESDREQIQSSARFSTRSEETLFALSVRELSASDSASRLRAAQRLKALGARAAVPALAAALHAEQESEVACALIEALAAVGDSTILPLVRSHLESPSVEARLSALEAAARFKDEGCFEQAADDDSPRVRRRAAILAAAGGIGFAALSRGAGDKDPSVRRVAVLGLAAASGPNAQAALLSALDDGDASVRRAAAKGLSNSFGPEIFAVPDLEPGRRRREIRRISARGPFAGEPPTVPAPDLRKPSAAGGHGAAGLDELESETLSRVYAALRGQSLDELVQGSSASREQVLAAAASLEKRGQVVRRGPRYYVP